MNVMQTERIRYQALNGTQGLLTEFHLQRFALPNALPVAQFNNLIVIV